MIELFILIGAVVVFVMVLNVRSRVWRLEQLIKGGAIQPSAFQPIVAQQQPAPVDSFTAAAPVQTEPDWSEKFIKWLKEDWLLKIGALFLLIGFGWLTTYAFMNNWIGPMGRIAIGIIAGALFIVLGYWRIRNYINQGGIFLVLGSTTILLTIFAAREIYNFFTPFSALLVMFLSTAFVALASVKYNSRSLALSSLVLAGVAPLLTNVPSLDYIELFAYLLVVVLGAVWIVALTGRRELTMAALILVVLYSFPHFASSTLADRGILLLFAFAFSTVFFFTNTIGILKSAGKEITFDLVTAAGNGLFLLTWIMVAAQDEWKSLIIAAWMIVFSIGAFMIFQITQRREPFYVYAGIGIAMLAAATSAELEGATLTIAYTIESGIISLLAYQILHDVKIAERMSWLLAVPVILSFENMASHSWATGVIHKDFFVLSILGMAFFILGLLFMDSARESESEEPKLYNAILLIAGSVYAYIILWLSLHAMFYNKDTAVMISLLVYTVIGLITYFYGLLNDGKKLRLYGGTVLGLVIVRLLLVDVWKMELTGRIITFFLMGALLVSTAFLRKKKQQ